MNASAKSNVEVTFLPLRSKTGASGVYNYQECSQILPGWSGSAGISGGGLLAAASELDVATSLFVGGMGSIHSCYHICKIEICCNNRIFAILCNSIKWQIF